MRLFAGSSVHFRFGRVVTTLLILGSILTARTASALGAVWAPFDLPKLQQTELKSAAGAPYRIIVATPAGAAPARGYPVIYVVDGNAWTGLVSEIIRANIDVGVQSRVEPAVVVGIGYPTDKAFDLIRRKLDFTPPTRRDQRDPQIGDGPVGGDRALMDFIDSAVKPVIETRFSIDRSRQTLIGHSMGGLFTLSTMLDRPQSFQTYVALSPSIWWDHGVLLREVRALAGKKDIDRKLRVFISVGGLEQHPPTDYIAHYRAVEQTSGESASEADKELKDNDEKSMVFNVRQMATLLSTAHIDTRLVEFPDEDHFSVVPAALGRAVPFAFEDDLSAH